MRRKDKAISDRKSIDRIIHESLICHLACSQDDQPYVIPISFGYDGDTVYFHTARAGKKNDIFLSNPRVCLSFETDIKLITDQGDACGWTFYFQSVIAAGEIKEIVDPDLKLASLNQIMRHYSGKDWEILGSEISNTKIWGVELESITGKGSPAK